MKRKSKVKNKNSCINSSFGFTDLEDNLVVFIHLIEN